MRKVWSQNPTMNRNHCQAEFQAVSKTARWRQSLHRRSGPVMQLQENLKGQGPIHFSQDGVWKSVLLPLKEKPARWNGCLFSYEAKDRRCSQHTRLQVPVPEHIPQEKPLQRKVPLKNGPCQIHIEVSVCRNNEGIPSSCIRSP